MVRGREGRGRESQRDVVMMATIGEISGILIFLTFRLVPWTQSQITAP